MGVHHGPESVSTMLRNHCPASPESVSSLRRNMQASKNM
jgi:hypothetical protein